MTTTAHNATNDFIRNGLNQVQNGMVRYSKYHMDKLIALGYVEKVQETIEEYSGFGRPRTKFVITKRGRNWLNQHKSGKNMPRAPKSQKPFSSLSTLANSELILDTLVTNLPENDRNRKVMEKAKDALAEALAAIRSEIEENVSEAA